MLMLLLAAALDPIEPYHLLVEANRAHDPVRAVSAYAPDAVLTFDAPGQAPLSFTGRDAILSSYRSFFAVADGSKPVEVEFRFSGSPCATDRHDGAYRVTLMAGDRRIVSYGRFTALLRREENGWRFTEDRGAPTTAEAFRALPPFDLAHACSATAP
jgi:ketosteroid isomerase-like protein